MTQGYIRHRRRKGTRASVWWAERLSRGLITFGGIGTIIAVCGVFLFLLWVVKDLFGAAEIGPSEELTAARQPVCMGADEYRTLAWEVVAGGSLRVLSLHDGAELLRRDLTSTEIEGLTAVSVPTQPRRPDARTTVVDLALGFGTGHVVPVELRFETRYFAPEEVPAEVRGLDLGVTSRWRDGLIQRTPIGQYRLQTPVIEVAEPAEFGEPVLGVHRAMRAGGPVLAVLTAGADGRGRAYLRTGELREDLLTMETELVWRAPVQLPLPEHDSPPAFIRVIDLASNVVVAWRDGDAARVSVRNTPPVLAEQVDLVPAAGGSMTACGVLLGDSTLLVGDSQGGVHGWFVRNDPTNEVDTTRLVRGHSFQLGDAAVRSFATSERERIFVAGTDDGAVHALFMTSEKRLGHALVPGGGPVLAVAIGAKDDALLAATERGVVQWDFDPRHPEVTTRALFGKVWYERHDGPGYAWQSSSGTDEFEKKFSLVPLVFGTVKATFYSMLFGVPLALLAAIYTSEFLHRRTRARIKPLIEMMASLPSVVLGFLAALVVAPFVESVVPAVLCAFATIPLAVLTGAYLWRLVPRVLAVRLDGLRLCLSALAIGCGGVLAVALAAPAERLLFAGDIRAWLDGQVGTGHAAWFMMFLPIAAVLVAYLQTRWLNPRLRRSDRTPRSEASLHLAKFAGGAAATLAIALGFAYLCHDGPTAFGLAALDPRGGLALGDFDLSPIGTYDQRNALVVGFIMGFAVIPIIYTIAEDALSSVPGHLRAASLGAGATPWQTATRIVVPTAMSGLFSAIMIGLGRAVGETMIVLMAAGNTPVLAMNTFSGFRTLSANIATELPEAPRDSTHYRTLFLAALVLFAMTFIINTLAEIVRLRFRRRAVEL
ncbi:MAG: ABC transporter permease subunit [Planctomycetota bacterium]